MSVAVSMLVAEDGLGCEEAMIVISVVFEIRMTFVSLKVDAEI